MKDFVVLVPAYNEERTIERCLNSLLRQEDIEKLNWSICVIANNCSDSTVEIVNNLVLSNGQKNKITIIKTDKRGKARALNLGMRFQEAKKYVVMDADSYLKKDCLIKIYKECEKDEYKIVGALDQPVFKNKKSLLYEYQLAQQIYREERGRVLPVGRFYMFDSGVIDSFPEFLHSEDTWIDLEIANRFGWESVKVAMDAIVFFTPVDNWLDFIKQESRFESGLPQIIEHFPKLEKVWKERRSCAGRVREKGEVFKNVRSRLKEKNINPVRIDEYDTFILDIIEDNAKLMNHSLITKDGLWEPIISTKK